MILHVANTDKFIEPFITFVEDNFDDFERHEFFLFGDNRRHPVLQRGNTRFAEDYKSRVKVYSEVLKLMCRAEKIILHGLWNSWIVKILAFNPWLLNKCYWMIWGGDLYSYKLAARTIKWQIHEVFRRIVIKRMGHLVTYIDGDIELARKWYGAKGKSHECLMYTSNVFKPMQVPPKKSSTINIQIGNSADPSNEHFEMLEILEKYREEDIKIYAPLSYGPKDHAYKVKDEGEKIFGDKFVAMLGFMPYEKYLEFLGEIDVAIFNHRRQQAMGNTISLLGLGKKVYMRSDVSQWYLFARLGACVGDINAFSIDQGCDGDVLQKNADIISSFFSKEGMKKQYRKIFEEAI